MVADGTGKIDTNLSGVDISSLSEEQKAELMKKYSLQRLGNIQAGIEAGLAGNKAKLEEAKAKFLEGKSLSGKLFKEYGKASDTYLSQSTTVWSANRSFTNTKAKYNVWNTADMGYQAFKSGSSGDMTSFSGGVLGSPITNPDDSSRIANQGSFISNRTYQLGKKMDSEQENLSMQQETLASNKKDKDGIGRQLDDQIWSNRLIVDEMEYYTNLTSMYYLHKQQNS